MRRHARLKTRTEVDEGRRLVGVFAVSGRISCSLFARIVNQSKVNNLFTTTKGAQMAKYLIRANYTLNGTKGLIKKGGTTRRAAVEQMLTGLGGKLESFYFAFGETDVFIIADIPDAKSAAAVSVTVNAAGGAQVTTTPLMTPEEMDEACKKSVRYQAPGA